MRQKQLEATNGERKEGVGSLADAWRAAGTLFWSEWRFSSISPSLVLSLALIAGIQALQRAFFKLSSLCAHIFHALQVPVLPVLIEVWLDCVTVHDMAHFSFYRFSRWSLVCAVKRCLRLRFAEVRGNVFHPQA